MKKKLFLIVLILAAIYTENVYGQPLPGDNGLGAESGRPVGGGADLDQNMVWMLLISLIYLTYKFRGKINLWFSSSVS